MCVCLCVSGSFSSASFSAWRIHKFELFKVKTHVLARCRVATEAARHHPHLHCTSLNLPAQKARIKQPTKQMRFPYIRQTVITFPMLSLFLCRVLPQPEPESWGCIWGGSQCSLQGLPYVSSAYKERRSLQLRRLIWCVCKQRYRWKRFRRCLASINPICVLTHFKCACHCTHEMRETLRWSNGCNISKDFSGHTKEMSSLRDLHSVKRKAGGLLKRWPLRGWFDNLFIWKSNTAEISKGSWVQGVKRQN